MKLPSAVWLLVVAGGCSGGSSPASPGPGSAMNDAGPTGAGKADAARTDGSGPGTIPGTGGAPGTGGSPGSTGGASGTTGGTGGTAGGAGGTTGTGGMPGAPPGPPAMAVKGPDVTITEFVIPTPSSPGAICAGPDGKIWFTHQSTAPSAIGNLSVDGTGFGLFRTSVTNIGPIAITPGPDGNVWYTKHGGVGKSTPAGVITEYGVPQGGDSGGIIKGPDNNLWFTEPVYDRIGKVTPAGQFTIYPLPATGRNPTDIAVGPDGNLWFTESATAANKIGRITPTGMVTEYPIPTPNSDPRAITSGPDGNLWFVEHDGHAIGRITPAGVVTEFGIPSAGRPTSITKGPDGNLWFTEPGATNAIGRATPAGGISEYPVPTANSDPSGIAAGPDGNLWFTEKSVNKIARLGNLAGGGNLPSAMGDLGTPLGGGMMCMKDIDCVGTGKACGGDVCSWKTTAHVCVLANTTDPGYCTVSTDCWCSKEGATCDAATHRCSFTSHAGQPPPM
jgi:streptogramin lyase